MNEKLIKTLKEERKKLYPDKNVLIPRSCGKTYLVFIRAAIYIAYEHVCSIYKLLDYEVTLEQAHKDINKFIAKIISELINE